MKSATILSLLSALLVACFGSAFVVAPNQNIIRSTTMFSTALSMSDTEKKTGTVKWFNTLKGYGFIVPDDGSTDVFVHQTEIKAAGFRSLADGESVEYVPFTEANGRMKATKVTGPGGVDVQGAPFEPRENDRYDQY